MADANIDFSKGSEYVIFSHYGKTMIGKFYKDDPDNKPAIITQTGGIHSSLPYSNVSVFYVANPAVIEWDLTIPSGDSAELSWRITPLYFKPMINSNSSNYNEVIVTYPMASIAITTIGGSIINSTLLAAYKELCE